MRGRLLLLCLALFITACSKNPVKIFEYTTEPLEVKGRQSSMAGPVEENWIRLDNKPELVWLLGFEVEVLDAGSQQPAPEEFLCHASLDLLPENYDASLVPPIVPSPRLFTLSQGLTKVEFPPGFGLPLVTRDGLRLNTQVLNLNDQSDTQVQYRVRLRYIEDDALEAPLKALFLIRAPVVKSVDESGATFGSAAGDSACSPGQNASPDNYLEQDSEGEQFIPHWKLSQGREVSKSLITERLGLSKDLSCHYAVAHVHPSAESLELVDLSNMESIIRTEMKSDPNSLRLEEIPVFSSVEGLTLKADHDYGLVSTYNNQSGRELDAMAVMYLYVHDPDYRPPTKLEVSVPIPPQAKVLERAKGERNYLVESPLAILQSFYTESLDGSWQGPEVLGERVSWHKDGWKVELSAHGSQHCEVRLFQSSD